MILDRLVDAELDRQARPAWMSKHDLALHFSSA